MTYSHVYCVYTWETSKESHPKIPALPGNSPSRQREDASTLGAKTIKKNTNSTQNKSQTHRAKQYEVTSFLSTDCELSTETCSKNVYSLGPRSPFCRLSYGFEQLAASPKCSFYALNLHFLHSPRLDTVRHSRLTTVLINVQHSAKTMFTEKENSFFIPEHGCLK